MDLKLITLLFALMLCGSILGGAIVYYLYADIPNTPTLIQPSDYFLRNTTPNIQYYDDNVKINLYNISFYVAGVKPTGSMRPAVSDNSELIIVNISQNEIRVGDVIVFYCDTDNNKTTTNKIFHRVTNIYVENNTIYYLTKGDNNKKDDEEAFNCKIKYDDIDGKVVGVFY